MNIVLLLGLFMAGASTAAPIPAQNLAPEVLEQCDASAEKFRSFHPAIKSSARTLIDLGAFTEAEFRNVKIGYCGLRTANGPVATTSCRNDIILLDENYRLDNQRLVMTATLAHEMKHYLQHAQQRTRYGPGYCESEHYEKDKRWMEIDADKFGDEVAALLFAGRPVEIRNRCSSPLSLYLETATPRAAIQSFFDFLEVPPLSNAVTPHRSTSKFFKVYARSENADGNRVILRDTSESETRDIGGKTYRLKNITMASKARSSGPFVLRLTCQ